MKKSYIIVGILIIAVLIGGYFLFFAKDISGEIVIPYIAHQKPRIDPHIPSAVPIADKLDEAIFDGLFNISANPSGITYEDGLGELMGIDADGIVTVRLKPRKKWHSSYSVLKDDDQYEISEKQAVLFTAQDLRFTLRRIQRLGSLSPDYILVSQAVHDLEFSGPDDNNEIRFKFRLDRDWKEAEIKEVLSFKILPNESDLNAPNYLDGTGPYIYAGVHEDQVTFMQNPSEAAQIGQVVLEPYIDNSTYTTELKNGNINTLLSTPFGSISPLLAEPEEYFYKSNISTTYFALLFNVQRLSQEQRQELRKFIDHEKILERFFKVGTEQQRHITDYKGNNDNYNDYLNYSMFPSSSIYVEGKTVLPLKELGAPDLSLLTDTVHIQTCLNYGFREELAEIVNILNDPALFRGKIKASAVQNEEIKKGNYDGLLVAVSGYRSNFLFDLYDLFLREPDFATKKINLITSPSADGGLEISAESFQEDKNFFRIDLTKDSPEWENFTKIKEYVYGFMASNIVGDKQAYAQFIDDLDQELALGSWLFSLPSLAYFSTQFENKSIDLYGVASQLSTIEKWREKEK
ncbi:MAG: hypothetical protein JXR46_01995 [Calditrichaceae bacterium]|nr:hypothetical protein [Calditrichaceae bacterium]MBN2707792.1 hypothetical protein [Calditrichaceae bacterium]RQV96282.1 MAG: hypothetical protein EH224_04960 [Calditrichota bacterium]